MPKNITAKLPKSEAEYRQQKANCNLYERTWRKKNPEKHEKNSKEFRASIVKSKTLSKSTQKKIIRRVEKNLNRALGNS